MNTNVKIFLLLMVFLSIADAHSSNRKAKIWAIEYHNGSEKINYKQKKIENYAPQALLDLIFSKNKNIHPRIILIKNDIAYVNIEGDAGYITNRSGTTGAREFGAIVVFNLTEFSNIKYVHFVDEGEHFGIGTYERFDYWSLMDIKEKRKYKTEIESRLNAKREDVVKYIYFLQEIGDKESIKQLSFVKEQVQDVDFGPCKTSESEFVNLVNRVIRLIESRN